MVNVYRTRISFTRNFDPVGEPTDPRRPVMIARVTRSPTVTPALPLASCQRY